MMSAEFNEATHNFNKVSVWHWLMMSLSLSWFSLVAVFSNQLHDTETGFLAIWVLYITDFECLDIELCKSLKSPTFLCFAYKESGFIVVFFFFEVFFVLFFSPKVTLNNSSSAFLKVLQSLSLKIVCFSTHFVLPHYFQSSVVFFVLLFVCCKLLNTEGWIIQA